MRRRQALSVVEMVVCFGILAFAIPVLFSSFSSSYRFSAMTRNRSAAVLLAGSFLEELKSHEYGQPAPKTWPGDHGPPPGWDAKFNFGNPNFQRIDLLVYGRPARLEFYRQLKFENGSFIGRDPDQKTDKATLTLYWHEDIGNPKEGNKTLVAEMALSSPW